MTEGKKEGGKPQTGPAIPDTDKNLKDKGKPAGKTEAEQLEMKGKAFALTAIGKAGKKALVERDKLAKAEEAYDNAMNEMLAQMKKNGKKKVSMKDSKGITCTFFWGITEARESLKIKEER